KYYFDTKYIKCEVSALFSAGTPPDFVHRTYLCHITKMYNPPLNLGYLKKYAFQLPQMEYTRFPGAADEPPCPGEGYVDVARKGRFWSASIFHAFRCLTQASSPPGQGRLPQRYIARRKSGFLFQGVSRIPSARLAKDSPTVR